MDQMNGDLHYFSSTHLVPALALVLLDELIHAGLEDALEVSSRWNTRSYWRAAVLLFIVAQNQLTHFEILASHAHDLCSLALA